MNQQDYSNYLKSAHWAGTREKRLELDNYRCFLCGKKKHLNVHHIRYKNLGNEDVGKDLVTLCRECHKMLHNIRDVVQEEYNGYINADNTKDRKLYFARMKNCIEKEFIVEMWKRDVHFGGDLRVFNNKLRVINRMLKMVDILYPDVKGLDIAASVRKKIGHIEI